MTSAFMELASSSGTCYDHFALGKYCLPPFAQGCICDLYSFERKKEQQKNSMELMPLSSEGSLSSLEAIKMIPYDFFQGASVRKYVRCCTCSSSKSKQ